VTAALYRVVSAPAGQRDWESIRHHYHPDARLVRTVQQEGRWMIMSIVWDNEWPGLSLPEALLRPS
jgi:hypothetical protein